MRHISAIVAAILTAAVSSSAHTAKSVIYIYLDGGSSQTDTFDPKPEAGKAYTGKYTHPIATNVPGTIIGERLVKLAAIADRYSIIRGMYDGTNGHETAHYRMLTGDMTGGETVYPSYGAMIAYKTGKNYNNPIFPYICITEASTRFNEAGFLNVMFKPYDTEGNPNGKWFDVSGIVNHAMPDEKLRERRNLLETVSALGVKVEPTDQVREAAKLRDRSFELMLGESRKAFDIASEPDSLRDAYGRSNFGQSCLAARKLVENGVTVVMVRFRGWDTHKEHFKRMDQRLDELDAGVSSLILDLEGRGLLDSTIIVVGGEFGRTPQVMNAPPWNGGRGHYGMAFSYIVAGGGFAGGRIVGATDAKGEVVTERRVYPADLWASVYTLMGIDPEDTVSHPVLGDIPILPSYLKQGQSNGMLKEIMKDMQ